MISLLNIANKYHRVDSIRAVEVKSVRNTEAVVLHNGNEVTISIVSLLVEGRNVTAGQWLVLNDDGSVLIVSAEYLAKYSLVVSK